MADGSTKTDTPPIRKFAVQPVETISRSNRSGLKKGGKQGAASGRSAGKEASTTELAGLDGERKASSPLNPERADGTGDNARAPSQPPLKSGKDSGSTVRKFAPQLVETSKRTRRPSQDSTASTDLTQERDSSARKSSHARQRARNLRSDSTEREKDGPEKPESQEQGLESRFSSEALRKKAVRQTSFRVPCLEPINSIGEKDGSDGSNVPSLSTSPSAASEDGQKTTALPGRPNGNGKFSGYLLALAAQTAERQLKEQALAAYPNEKADERVDHFIVDGSSGSSDEDRMRSSFAQSISIHHWGSNQHRDSEEDLDYTSVYTPQRRNLRKNRLGDSSHLPATGHPSERKDAAPKRGHGRTERSRKAIGGQVREEGELKKMRKAANPPMLGSELKFPLSESPQATRMDATQRPKAGALSATAKSQENVDDLWSPHGTKRSKSPQADSSSTLRESSRLGLWNGVCHASGPLNSLTQATTTTAQQTGLVTPRVGSIPGTPSTPSSRTTRQKASAARSFLSGVDNALSIEASIRFEYPDSFVTQIYNYLSLGYPAMAHKFDSELSKISRIPIEDIRKGDMSAADYKGYVGTPEGQGWDEDGVRERCGRWLALKLYIWEWARQQPRMAAAEKEDWGMSARRGSWAI